MKHRVYFFLCGITAEISFISRRTGSFPLAAELAVPFDFAFPFVLFVADRLGRSSSRRRFLDAGSELGSAARVQTWREIWLKSSM